MPGQNSSKGNPASHRMSNPALKARRARNWAEQRKRKDAHRALNEQRAQANRARRERGEPTPHEVKTALRRQRRDALRAQGLLPPIGTTRAQWDKGRRAA